MKDGFKQVSLSRRLLAFLVDHLIFCIFTLLLFYVLLVINGLSFESANTSTLVGFTEITIVITFILYSFKDTFGGKSIGRRIMKIAVRDRQKLNTIPSTLRLMIRNLALFIWPLELLIVIVNPKRLRVGDYIARTVIVTSREEIN